jgi:predicted DsbA family dithiol-disulfide isomerase
MPRKQLSLVLYQDVFCAWSYLAELRLAALQNELGKAVHLSISPYPVRVADDPLTRAERASWIEESRQAHAEPEGGRIRADLWLGLDPPRSTLPPLLALEAAAVQGEERRQLFCRAMLRAALEGGINVARSDVILELASAAGLEMDRFVACYQSPMLRRLILEERQLARARGVNGVPTLVIAGRWMISGLREVAEYRRYLVMCMRKLSSERGSQPERVLH